MGLRALSDAELVTRLTGGGVVSRELIDEYYRRCIPLYLDFLGAHWHTGFYSKDQGAVSARDQVRMIDHIAHSVGLRAGERVLDVGCGVGATLCHLNLHHGCEAVGLTPVREQKALAEKIACERQANIQIDLGHAEKLPYADRSFDVVMFFESSCHFEDRQAFFNEVYRILKPGGRLAGEDWMAIDLLNEEQRRRWIEPICKAWAIPMLGDLSEYRQLMASASLTDIIVTDMRELMPLRRGFSISQQQLDQLQAELEACANPLLRLTLQGLMRLGMAVGAGAFTIGQVNAVRPTSGVQRRLMPETEA